MPRYDAHGAPRTVSILLGVMGLLALLLGAGLLVMDPGYGWTNTNTATGMELPVFGAGTEAVAALILGLLGLLLWVAAWAVAMEKRWAWGFALGMCFVGLFIPPVLTVLALITLLLLGSRDTRKRLGAPV